MLCREGGGFGADGLSVLLANMSGLDACFEGEICLISDSATDNGILESDCQEEYNISSSLRRDRFLRTLLFRVCRADQHWRC